MKGLRELRTPSLVWSQPKFGVDHFVSRSGEDLLGEIYWRKWFSDEAVARLGEHSWLIDRIGFFRDRAVAIALDTQQEVAQVTFDWLKDGNVTTADGRAYRWYRTKSLGNAWAMAVQEGPPLYEIEFGMRWFKHQVYMSFSPGALARPEIDLLVCLGLYLAYITLQDAAGAIAATSAVAAV